MSLYTRREFGGLSTLRGTKLATTFWEDEVRENQAGPARLAGVELKAYFSMTVR